MFFGSRSKHYPHLSEFLEYKAQEMRRRQATLGIVGGVAGIVAGLFGALIGILAGTGAVQFSTTELVSAIVFLNVGTWAAIGGFYLAIKRRRERQQPDRAHKDEADKVSMLFAQSLARRRLHRDLDPSAGRLLEEATRNFMRIRKTLDATFWSGHDLPVHWKTVRSQALLASDQAMDEILVIFRDCLRRGHRPSGVFEFIEGVVDELQGGRLPDSDVVPAGFDQARHIAERLKLLAAEIEKATGQVFKDEAVADDFIASTSIELCLGELKTIRRAEDELRENLRH